MNRGGGGEGRGNKNVILHTLGRPEHDSLGTLTHSSVCVSRFSLKRLTFPRYNK